MVRSQSLRSASTVNTKNARTQKLVDKGPAFQKLPAQRKNHSDSRLMRTAVRVNDVQQRYATGFTALARERGRVYAQHHQRITLMAAAAKPNDDRICE